jgi:general secretion pathway protein A
MYEAFFGLDEKPFNLTPDPRFLYLSEKHKEALAHLKYAIENRTGFVMVSGEVGTGKTTICRTLIHQLDADTELACVFNPMLSPKELLSSINQDFGIRCHSEDHPRNAPYASRGDTIKELIDELNDYLLARNAAGKNCVLVIDEAQDLKPEVLEQVRLLSNLETETQKLLQIVLIGQPELAQNLELPELRQLNQRITARYHLNPLSKRETLQYIAFRLRVASGKGKVSFTRGAVSLVHKFSGGTPRVINGICDRALLVAYTRETRDVTSRIVRQAAREVRGTPVRKPKWSARRVALPEPRKEQLELFPDAGARPLPEQAPRRRVPSAATVLLAVVVVAGVWYMNVTSWQWATRQGVTLPAPATTVSASHDDTTTPGVGLGGDLNTRSPFVRLLNTLEPAEARTAAGRALLRAWGVEDGSGVPRGDSWEDLTAFGRVNGLDYTLLYPATDQLLTINLPAFVRMAGDAHSLWLALLHAEKDRFELTTAQDKTIQISRAEFQEHFTTETVILWKDPTPDAPALVTSMLGEAVLQLQKNLQSLGRYNGSPSGVYDQATATSVARIQAETGLTVDGTAGKGLRMVLCSWWLSGISTPSLRPASSINVHRLIIESHPSSENLSPGNAEEKVQAALDALTAPPLDTDGSLPIPAAPPAPETTQAEAAPELEPVPATEEVAPAILDSQQPEPVPVTEEPAPAVFDSPQPDAPNPQAESPPENLPEQAADVIPESPPPVPNGPAESSGSEYLLPPEGSASQPEPVKSEESARAVVEELPPPATAPHKEVTPPVVATSPLVPREPAALMVRSEDDLRNGAVNESAGGSG